MSQRTPKYVIIDHLFENSTGKTALSRLCNTSVTKTSKALDELITLEVVKKTSKGNAYCLNPEILYVILKLSGEKAELISYVNKENVTRQALEPLYSLSDDENIAFFVQSAKEYCTSFADKYFAVTLSVIYDGKSAPSKLSTSLCPTQKSRQELIASAISELFANESVLYVNLENPICLLCKGGEVFGEGISFPQSIDDVIAKALLLFKPDRVVLNGKSCAWLSDVCEQAHVTFSLLPPFADGLYLDERKILIEAICNMQ